MKDLAGVFSESRRCSLRVLVVPDKFKGTLTAGEAAAAIARGWRRKRPHDTLTLLPMSDGGDGFGAVVGALLGAQRKWVDTVDAAGRPLRASWWWEPRTRTAVVESASVIGLAMLSGGGFHPFDLDTRGLGPVLEAVAAHQPRVCLVGVGGSATNDGGFGLARALGWRFVSRGGADIVTWTRLARCALAAPPARPLPLGRVVVALDVANPLLGPRGCSRVYGPQKGLKPRDMPRAERALKRLAEVLCSVGRREVARVPGAGAAGGLGFALMAFLNARPEPGFDIFAKHSQLRRRIRAADVVITGEGSLDDQSLMGKGVGRVAELCRDAGVPCVALAGAVKLRPRVASRLAGAWALAPDFVTVEEALGQPARHLSRLAAQVAETRFRGKPGRPGW